MQLSRALISGACLAAAAPLGARLPSALFPAVFDLVPALFPLLALDNNELTLLAVFEALPHPCTAEGETVSHLDPKYATASTAQALY
jgi:hypothetical protein